jgi:hypothetical protein
MYTTIKILREQREYLIVLSRTLPKELYSTIKTLGEEREYFTLIYLKLSIRIIASKASRGRNTIFRSTDG